MKISLSLLPPFTLRLLGLGSGALLLFLLARLRRADILPARAVWPGIVAGGLLSIAVFNLAVAWAQLSTSTARAAVLTFTMPMMSALLARFVLGERLDGRRALALLLGGLGVAVLAWPALRAAVSGADPSALRGLVFPDRRLRLGRRHGLPEALAAPGDRVVVTAWQLSIGALCALAGMLLAGESFPLQGWSVRVAGR